MHMEKYTYKQIVSIGSAINPCQDPFMQSKHCKIEFKQASQVLKLSNQDSTMGTFKRCQANTTYPLALWYIFGDTWLKIDKSDDTYKVTLSDFKFQTEVYTVPPTVNHFTIGSNEDSDNIVVMNDKRIEGSSHLEVQLQENPYLMNVKSGEINTEPLLWKWTDWAAVEKNDDENIFRIGVKTFLRIKLL